jgi:hypothetical protein
MSNLLSTIIDLTINDSANSNKNTSRSKKSFSNNRSETIIKQIEELNVTDEPLENEEDDVGDDIGEFKNKPNSRRRRLKGQLIEDPNHTYASYHIDIWHCISQHISPEDVGRFALICHQTASVVTSAQFWFRLYKRYYRHADELPMRLQPECMVRLYGLRASTIRSLFFTYDPFVQRLKTTTTDIHTTERKQVVTMWTQQSALKLWHFFFKIKCKLNHNCRAVVAEQKLKNNKMLEYLSDVYMNRDEGCQVLVVSACRFFFPISSCTLFL